ncbi:MAG: hypothetical protein PHS99_06705 [Candidatus Marinimicrobia bacterium]|nr:hypothetical protein [Candidatus Neomarinimicrobiota bacterium]
MDLLKSFTDQSLEYPKAAVFPLGHLFLTARDSQNLFIQCSNKREFKNPFRLEKDVWDGHGLFVDMVVSEDAVYTVRRDL